MPLLYFEERGNDLDCTPFFSRIQPFRIRPLERFRSDDES